MIWAIKLWDFDSLNFGHFEIIIEIIFQFEFAHCEFTQNRFTTICTMILVKQP